MDARARHRDGSNRSGFGGYPGVCPRRRTGRRNRRIDRHRQRAGRRRRHRSELAQRHQPGAATADIFGPARRIREPRTILDLRAALGLERATAVDRRHIILFAAERALSGVERPAAGDPPAGDAREAERQPGLPERLLAFRHLFRGPRKATITWCFDDKGGGRYLYSRTDQGSFYCHGFAQARWNGQKLDLSSANPTCDDRNIKVPSDAHLR